MWAAALTLESHRIFALKKYLRADLADHALSLPAEAREIAFALSLPAEAREK
jgi:hypothetical protein